MTATNPDTAARPGAGSISGPSGSESGVAVVPAPGSGSIPEREGRARERSDRAWTVLIAALGGEGGGVLSNWLVDAAAADGRRVQATSVPGVAQRTGATTYYLEIGPHGSGGESGDAPRPNDDAAPVERSGPVGQVMALLPTPGNVDLLVASELLEAGRAAQTGMITPDRTTVIASTHRTFAIAEKSAMGDGRFEDERIRRAVRELSRRHVLTDLGKVAERAGTVVSSVLLGAVAGSNTLPIPRERLRAAIELAGIAVEANLRGFDAGCRLFDETHTGTAEPDPERTPLAPHSGAASARRPDALAVRVEALPEPVREIARLGVERTVDYQDLRYGSLYLDRIERLLARTGVTQATPADVHDIALEVARQLALWMCFEDIIRVADLKTRRSRIERVRSEVRAKPGQPVVITEFLKPGVDEWCSILPAWLARPVLRAADRGGWRRRLNVGLHVRTSSVSGFLLLWSLARLKRLRRGMHRFVEEQARIETWLVHVAEAFGTSADFALEAARCANLVKGYGDTHERGGAEFRADDGIPRRLRTHSRARRQPAHPARSGARRPRGRQAGSRAGRAPDRCRVSRKRLRKTGRRTPRGAVICALESKSARNPQTASSRHDWSSIRSCSENSFRISSIWVGNRLTPRMISMSSQRPVTFCIRRIEREVPGISRVRSPVR